MLSSWSTFQTRGNQGAALLRSGPAREIAQGRDANNYNFFYNFGYSINLFIIFFFHFYILFGRQMVGVGVQEGKGGSHTENGRCGYH
jgi:hypothetical protein